MVNSKAGRAINPEEEERKIASLLTTEVDSFASRSIGDRHAVVMHATATVGTQSTLMITTCSSLQCIKAQDVI